MSNPDDKHRREIWNIVAMEHVAENILHFERRYREVMEQSLWLSSELVA